MKLRGWVTAVAVTLGVTLVSMPGQAWAGSNTGSHTTTVTKTVHRGANPHVAWLDRHSRVLHVGKRKIHLTMKGQIWSFRRVGSRRFVVQVGSGYSRNPASRLYVVGAGTPLLLTKRFEGVDYQYQLSVEPRGRIAYTAFLPGRPKFAVMRVQRVTDGRLIAHHTVHRSVQALAFRNNKVWRNQNGRLAVWDVSHNTVQPTSHPQAFDVDLEHGYGARMAKDHQVTFFPLGTKATWQPWHYKGLRPTIAGWSPDGRLVATLAGERWELGNADLGATRVVMRNAHTGQVVRTFRMGSGRGFFEYAARWENGHQLLVPGSLELSDSTERFALLRLGSGGSYNAASRTSSGSAYWSSPAVIPGWTANGTL